jgi:two-component system nitrogen regulation sensor histidine kinase NtrY
MATNAASRGWSKKGLRALWLTLILVLLSVSATTLYFKGLGAPSPFSNNILVLTLVNLNFILVILLTLLLSRNLIKLFFERRHQRLGTGFRTKLTVAFVGLSLIPSLLLFVVASGLLTAAVENWFGLQVERSLSSALGVAQSVYQEHEAGIYTQARSIGREVVRREWWAEDSRGELTAFLEAEAAGAGRRAIWLFPPAPSTTAAATWGGAPVRAVSPTARPPFGDPPEDVRSARRDRSVVRSTEHGEVVWGAVALMDRDGGPLGTVVIESVIPEELVAKLEGISQTYEAYNELKTFKNPIKGGYVLSFLIITLLIIFSATWFGFYVARGVTVPIQKLAEGTQAVAQGNLDFSINVEASDELRVLVDSFNTMTRDLKASKEQVERATTSLTQSNAELRARRTYMETILETIATGVVSVDNRGRVTIFNQAAERILGIPAAEATSRSVQDVFGSRGMDALSAMLDPASAPQDLLEREIQVEAQGRLLSLRVIVSQLRRPEQDLGLVMVFDDLSDLLKAQKAAAWQEVAQRIAHEIKNPLTPIQLSAQRLRKKAFEQAPDLRAVVDDATTAIISEVTSLKTMVDEFSSFARMPVPQPEPLDLHEVLREVIQLYQAAYRDVRFHASFGADVPRALADRDQMKRVFTNLVENAVEAIHKRGEVWIGTSYTPHPARIRIEVADDGPGIHPDDRGKLFLPYFSKKKTGTGLGLAIVQRIISDHNGHIRVADRQPRGTIFVVELPPAPDPRPARVPAAT